MTWPLVAFFAFIAPPLVAFACIQLRLAKLRVQNNQRKGHFPLAHADIPPYKGDTSKGESK